MLAFNGSEIFGVTVVEKHPWHLLLGKEGSKPTGVYRGSKIHGKISPLWLFLLGKAHGIQLCPTTHRSGKHWFYVPNPVQSRANQMENIQLKHVLSFKIMSLSSLVSLLLSSNLHWNSPVVITSHCHPKGTQNFGPQTAKLLSSFTKCPKQTLIFWNICSFTEPYFIFLIVTSLAGVQKI